VQQAAVHPNMRTFLLVWLGQVVSIFGSGLTSFSLGVWIYEKTGSATQFSFTLFAALLPNILLSPVMGALVDRWNRRWGMILSDTGAAVCTLLIALLYWQGRLEIWLAYLLVAVSSVFRAFQWPALMASTTLLVSKKQLSRANGMMQLGIAVAQILAPLVAGFALSRLGLHGVILVDTATYLFAVGVLLLLHIPQPEASAEGLQGKGTLVKESVYGWTYIRQRRGLLGLLILFALFNLVAGMIQVLLTPMVLSFADAKTLGTVLAVAGCGLVVGGLLMSAWGGPRHRMTAIYAVMVFQGAVLLLGGLGESAVLVAAAAFGYMLGMPILNGCNQAIWQSKVAPDLQGRVFATRRMISMSAMPLAYLVGGPLSDYVFEPLLAPGGALAGSVGRVLGVGPGRGIALLFMLLGVFMLVVAVAGYQAPRVRRVEEELPDAIPDTPKPDTPGQVVAAQA
jgi:MFS transporter, DHA3 family, macrolide efflux protein